MFADPLPCRRPSSLAICLSTKATSSACYSSAASPLLPTVSSSLTSPVSRCSRRFLSRANSALMRSRPPSESVAWSAFLTFADRFEDQYWMLTNSAPS